MKKVRIWYVLDKELQPIKAFAHREKHLALAAVAWLNAKDPKIGAFLQPETMQVKE